MKKPLFIFLTLILCLAILSGCGGNEPSERSSTPESTESVLPSDPTETEAPESTEEESSEMTTSAPTESSSAPTTSTAPPTTSKATSSKATKPPTTSSAPPSEAPPATPSYYTTVYTDSDIIIRIAPVGAYSAQKLYGTEGNWPSDLVYGGGNVLPVEVRKAGADYFGNGNPHYLRIGGPNYLNFSNGQPPDKTYHTYNSTFSLGYIPAEKLQTGEVVLTIDVAEATDGIATVLRSQSFTWNGSTLVAQ